MWPQLETSICLFWHFLCVGSFLYVATTRDIYLFDVGNNSNHNNNSSSKPLLLDHLGCEKGLWTPTAPNYSDAHLITGQKDALYFYNTEGRGQCYVFEVRTTEILLLLNSCW
jgi:hypothetical protein